MCIHVLEIGYVAREIISGFDVSVLEMAITLPIPPSTIKVGSIMPA